MKSSNALALTILALASTTANAGDYIGVAQPYFYHGFLYINTAGMTRTNRPACATRDFVTLEEGSDMSNPLLKAKFAVLLSAFMADRKVFLGGTGTCTSEGDEIIFVASPGS